MQINYLENISLVVDSLPLFSGLSPSQRQFISQRSQIIEVKKGQLIYKEGNRPDYFYCMVTGRVEIYHPPNKTRTRQEMRIECVRKGDYFGSISSLTGQPHTVSTRALNDSVLLRIDTKGFRQIMREIPRLGVLLSHSLSRRLGRKGLKEIFESTIVAVYGLEGGPDPYRYAAELAGNIKIETGKKVKVVKSGSIPNKKAVAPALSSLTADFHYVVVAVYGKLNETNLEILKQSEISHILSPSDKDSLGKTARLVRRLEVSGERRVGQGVFVVLAEDRYYGRISYKHKTRILSKDVFATLSGNKLHYNKALRRIAREISGAAVGLALGSGAAMGFAHIGVLKVIEQERIPIDCISAASMGSIIATLWAAGYGSNEIAKLARSFKSKLRTLFLVDPTLPIRGLIKGRAVRKILKDYLGNKTFFDLKLPLKIVACDIRSRKEFVIDRGPLVDAVMASIAIPGVFEPMERGGLQLVDGGIVNPVPISVLSRSGIKRIIAVNTLPSPEDVVRVRGKKLNIYDIIVNSFQAMEYTIASSVCQQADVYIHPIPRLADWYELYKADLFIKTGIAHTKLAIPKIKNLQKT